MGRPPAGKIQTWLHAQVEAATRDTLEEEEMMEVNCWNCGRLMPAEQAVYVSEPNADGTGFCEVQAGSCDRCVERTNKALDEKG